MNHNGSSSSSPSPTGPFRILVLNYEYPPIGGGAGEVSKFLAEGYARRGHWVRVLTARWGDLPSSETVDEHLQIRRIFAFRKAKDHCTVPQMMAFAALAIPSAVRLAFRWRPHVIHCHFAIPVGSVAWVVERLRGIPFIVTLHGGDVRGFVPEQTDRYFRLVAPMARRIVRRARYAVAVSEGLRALAAQSYSDARLTVIPNGVDVETFRPDPAKGSAPGSGPEERPSTVRIVAAARFTPQKGLHRLIEAVQILRESRVDGFTVDIYGGGPLEGELKALSTRLGTDDRVRFPGWISRADLACALGHADVFAIPSEIEGMPVACLQAMASGLAIVGSRTTGIEEVVADRINGLLVEVGDVRALSAALERLIRDRELLARMGAESRRIACEQFRWEVIVDRYLELLSQSVGRTYPPGDS